MWVWRDGRADSFLHSKALPVLPKPCSTQGCLDKGPYLVKRATYFGQPFFLPATSYCCGNGSQRAISFFIIIFLQIRLPAAKNSFYGYVSSDKKLKKSINNVNVSGGKNPTPPVATAVHFWRSLGGAWLILQFPQWDPLLVWQKG